MVGANPVPEALLQPRLSILGQINEAKVQGFLQDLEAVEAEVGDIALELTTLGGDAELARRIVLEIDRARHRLSGRFLFLGKTIVYSAGATIMSAFPREDRYLTSDAMLMVHCRQLEKTIEISGPLRASLPQVNALRAQLEAGIAVEEEGFRRLIQGSGVTLDELFERALHNWYLPAADAMQRGLIAGVVGPDDQPAGGESGPAAARG
ncbi:MAG: peptidase S14 [Sphingomonadaceae bacterium]|nr:peptidase S14 [Sphingomonadaceae bacterium]